jgi:hypothetical protein
MRTTADIDRRFLAFRTDLILCSRCLRAGARTPIPQVISHRHRPVTLCRDCRALALAARH